jgi:hypothetical protein
LQAFTEGLIEGHIATDIIITISGWAGPLPPAAGRGDRALCGLAKGSAGHCRERRINESGIEQTGVAFDVKLKCPHLSRERRTLKTL